LTAILLIALAAVPSGSGGSAWWIFLADRGPSLEQRLEERSAELAGLPSRDRREAAGCPSADEHDLVPWEGYVELVTACLSGSSRVRTVSRYLNAMSVEATPEEMGRIEALPFVLSTRPVGSSTGEPLRPLPAGGANDLSSGQLGQIGLDSLQAKGYAGEGVVIGVLDSGFNLWHVAFSGLDVLGQYDFLEGDPDPSQQPGDTPGQSNHGTAVLSILGGHEPGSFTGGAWQASFFLAKTEDTSDEYEQEEDFWVAGLEWLDDSGADIVSSSLGYFEWYAWEDMDGNTAVTTIAADIAASHGMPVINAVGNEGPGSGTLIAPSDGDSVLAIGGVDASGAVAEFSSRGPSFDGRTKPDVCARAVYAIFAHPEQDTGYSWGNGTSFATPLVSSAAAVLLQAHPEWDSMEALDAIRNTASLSRTPDDTYGWGVVDAPAAFRWNSVTGCVRRSDTGELLPGYPLTLSMEGSSATCSTCGGGWFAIDPGQTGSFTISGAGGEGTVIPVSGTLEEEGLEVCVYVDMPASGLPSSVFPNPSTGGIWIGFDLYESCDVELGVFGMTGQRLWTSLRPALEPGSYRAPLDGMASWWDGCGADGKPVASGVYIALLRRGGSSELLKFALVR
jgi:hypothetical protein